MKHHLTRVALAAMILTLPAAALRAQQADRDATGAPARIVIAIPSVGAQEDVDKISTSLKQVKGVGGIAGLTPQSKMVLVTYAPDQVSVQQIIQAIVDTPGAAGRPNQASLIVRVANLSDQATQDKASAALKKVPGVAAVSVLDAAGGTLAIQFAPMTATDRTGGMKGVTVGQITKALTDAGLTASADVSATPAPR
jgi:copper chaperone CopZ